MGRKGLFDLMADEVVADPVRAARLRDLQKSLEVHLTGAYRTAYEVVLGGSVDPGRKLGATIMAHAVLAQVVDQARENLADQVGTLFPGEGDR